MLRVASPEKERCWAALALIALTLLAAGCASTGARPTAAAAARPLVDPAEIPAAPAGVSTLIEDAWNALRGGGAVAPTAPVDGSAEGRALAGYRALRRGDAGAALADFEAALALRPGFAEAAYGTALVAVAQGRIDVAQQWFAAALEYDPGLVRAAVRLRVLSLERLGPALREAEAAQRSGDLDSALARYRAVAGTAPDLAPLYLRIADIQRVQGDGEGAVATLETGRRRAGDDPALLARLASVYRDTERYGEAYEVLRTLQALRPSDDDLVALTEETRRLYEEASLPAEYRELGDRPTISREELAAILAIALEGLEPRSARTGVIISDTAGRWSAPFVQRMVEWGVLDVYQNNAFWPDLEVTRSMLVEAAYRAVEALDLVDVAPRPAISDPPPEHLLYRPVQTVVGLGVMEMAGGGPFDLLEPVSGEEAIRSAERLADALRRLGS